MSDKIERLKYTFMYEILNPFIQRYEVYKWNRNGGIPPTPHIIKQRMVQKYANKYDTSVFVETGTYLGVMVSSIKKAFDEVYTIELDGKLYRRAKKKFAKDGNVEVIFGDSSKVLPRLLRKIDKPTLFWLDAHFSGGISARGTLVTPIIHELSKILKQKLLKSIILVDDANMFTGEGGYPTMEELGDLVSGISKRFIIKNENNIIVISER